MKPINLRAWLAGPAALLLAAALVAGCNQYNNDRGRGDAPVDRENTNDAPAYVINFPDKFHNVAVKCDPHGFRIFAHTRDGSPPVILPDETCKGQERGAR
jgi:hypothetical protein